VTQPGVPDAPLAGAASGIATRLERLAQIAAKLGDQALAADARADHDRLMEARFFVACLGQFKRGKSTLLNALVGEAILPVGVVPVTSVVTILRYGDPRAAIVRFSDGHTEPISLDAIAMFIDERQNPGNRRQAAIVDVALPSPILRDGLCLVDTPGLGSVHLANTEVTQAFVPRTDVALVLVGPDPPISGAELQLIEEVSREAGELMVVLNKADQASAEQLREVSEFTRTTVEKALARPIPEILEISALERLNLQHPTRNWSVLETHLTRLSSQTRQHLVDTAGHRSIRRLSHKLGAELALREDALKKPIEEIEAQVCRLRVVVDGLDRSLVDLRFLFDAVEAELGRQFEHYRTRFLSETIPELQSQLRDWIASHRSIDRSLRMNAFEEAHRLSVRAVDEWLRTVEPAANALYRAATERLIRLANEYIARVASDAADVDADDLPPEIGFRSRRHFYFTSLMHVTGGTPLTWLIDRFASAGVRRTHVARAATAYLTHLLESNSHRVENDLKERTRDSRRWLEGQIRTRLAGALQSAERGLAMSTEKQRLSEAEVEDRLARVKTLRGELASLTS
jgi:GTPase Era involved in 16S rRNA processing